MKKFLMYSLAIGAVALYSFYALSAPDKNISLAEKSHIKSNDAYFSEDFFGELAIYANYDAEDYEGYKGY